MNYFKDDKYLCPFYKNLALSYFYQDNDQGISYFQELLERYSYDYEIMDAYFSCLYKQNNLQELMKTKLEEMILVLVEVVKNIKNVVVNNEEVLSYFHTDHFDSYLHFLSK